MPTTAPMMLHHTPPSTLLTAQQVAERLGTTERHVRNLRARGQGPRSVRIPGLGVRWLSTELDAWLDEIAAAA